MSRPLKLHIVEQAHALIADEHHWCRGEDINGEEVCPTSASAVKRCGLGAVIAAAYQLTNDLAAAHELALKAPASKLRHRHTGPRQRYEGTCGCARAVR